MLTIQRAILHLLGAAIFGKGLWVIPPEFCQRSAGVEETEREGLGLDVAIVYVTLTFYTRFSKMDEALET